MRPLPARRPRAGVTGLVVAVLLALGALAGVSDAPAPAPQLQLTADASQFRAGNIISDALFFDGAAMSAGAVQGFLDDKGANCVNGPMPCLKNYRQGTWDRPADGYCHAYAGAADETAASIVAKVGRACGISQRALLVILQKEQGLVRLSGDNLTASRYQKAMGYGCPDTAPCNTQYYGFYNQVYNAARKFKVYAANPNSYGYKAGRINSILYNPNAGCGRSDVYIENQATAGLYVYTPYQPNQAALAAGYGPAAPCGAYGNRNFFLYYTDWFGSTQSSGGYAVVARGSRSDAVTRIGTATSSVVCGLVAGGCFQNYQRGAIYWSPTTGPQMVLGAIGGHWAALGWERSRLGYPTGEEICGLKASGCFQTFQGGSVYFSPATGAASVVGQILARWAGQRWETGPLGYPKGNERCGLVGGGCVQVFEGGTIYWSPASGAHIVAGALLDAWAARGWEAGPLGYPTGSAACGLADNGCVQAFQRGSLTSSAGTGLHVVMGPIRDRWVRSGSERGPLGYPTADTACGLASSGCATAFQKGAVYWTAATGARIVTGPVRDAWVRQGAERGPLGYPTSDTACPNGGCVGSFQNGAIGWTSTTGARIVKGAIWGRWAAQGSASGPLGYPTAEEACGLVRGGCAQPFQKGVISFSPATGAHVVSGAVYTEWKAQSLEAGRLGYPTGERICGLRDSGCFQHFEGGSVYSSAATGVHTVRRALRGAWAATGWERGPLGYPTANIVCGLASGGCSQQFQGGTVHWTSTTGGQPVFGAIRLAWLAAGAEKGALRYPTAPERCGLIRGGCLQTFQGGPIYFSPTTGAYPVRGAILSYWGKTGWEAGPLGYPVGNAATADGRTTQRFQGGTLVLNVATGQVTRR